MLFSYSVWTLQSWNPHSTCYESKDAYIRQYNSHVVRRMIHISHYLLKF